MLTKILFIINIQWATQYALYDKHSIFVGNLSVYEDNMYLKITGFLPDMLKIKYTNATPSCIIYYVENDKVRGSVTIDQIAIEFDIIINNRIHETHKFYRNKNENRYK